MIFFNKLVHSIMQEVQLLLNSKVDVNAKNLAGLTALDIMQHRSSSDNIRIRTMLCCVGAQEGASLPNVGLTHYLRFIFFIFLSKHKLLKVEEVNLMKNWCS